MPESFDSIDVRKKCKVGGSVVIHTLETGLVTPADAIEIIPQATSDPQSEIQTSSKSIQARKAKIKKVNGKTVYRSGDDAISPAAAAGRFQCRNRN